MRLFGIFFSVLYSFCTRFTQNVLKNTKMYICKDIIKPLYINIFRYIGVSLDSKGRFRRDSLTVHKR